MYYIYKTQIRKLQRGHLDLLMKICIIVCKISQFQVILNRASNTSNSNCSQDQMWKEEGWTLGLKPTSYTTGKISCDFNARLVSWKTFFTSPSTISQNFCLSKSRHKKITFRGKSLKIKIWEGNLASNFHRSYLSPCKNKNISFISNLCQYKLFFLYICYDAPKNQVCSKQSILYTML